MHAIEFRFAGLIREQAASLQSILERKGPDGRRVYSDEDIKALVPLFVVAAGADEEDLPEALWPHLKDLAAPGGDHLQDQLDGALSRYRARPVNPQLLADVRALVHGEGFGNVELEAVARAVGRVLGHAPHLSA